MFGKDNFYIELQHHYQPFDVQLNRDLVHLAHTVGIQSVATNNVHYADASKHKLQDILVCIRHNTTLEQAHRLLRPNAEFYLKAYGEMLPMFREHPTALSNTMKIAEACDFELPTGLQSLPDMEAKVGVPPKSFLQKLCEEGIQKRFGEPSDEIIRQTEVELDVIDKLGLSNYLVVVWDICQFARQAGIRFQVRGSAANALVIYLMGLSPINPLDYGLVFERFLSIERQNVPDIDIDFPNNRRDEVMQYVYDTYGYSHAARVCTFQTYRHKSILRDVAKALGLPRYFIEEIVALYDQDSATSLSRI